MKESVFVLGEAMVNKPIDKKEKAEQDRLFVFGESKLDKIKE